MAVGDVVEVRPSRRYLPDEFLVPVTLIGTFGVLAVSLGLYVLSLHRERTVERAGEETAGVASDLLAAADDLRGEGGADLLARTVVGTELLRGATVWLGPERVLRVGKVSTELTADRVADAAATDGVLTDEVGDGAAVRTTLAFARNEGQPVVLETEAPLDPPTIGWLGIAIAWGVIALTVLVVTALLERGRRDRVMTLEETVKALYAHDALVTRQSQDLLRSKTDFVTTISHELRTPLEVIKRVAEVLADAGCRSLRPPAHGPRRRAPAARRPSRRADPGPDRRGPADDAHRVGGAAARARRHGTGGGDRVDRPQPP